MWKRLLGWFSGKRSYITALAGAIIGVCTAQGTITESTGATILAILAGLFGIFLRAGVKKVTSE